MDVFRFLIPVEWNLWIISDIKPAVFWTSRIGFEYSYIHTNLSLSVPFKSALMGLGSEMEPGPSVQRCDRLSAHVLQVGREHGAGRLEQALLFVHDISLTSTVAV